MKTPSAPSLPDGTNRKPHNALSGYVTERKSKHPKLSGHFVIFDRDRGGEWMTGTTGNRWGVVLMNEGGAQAGLTFSSLKTARAIMVDMSNGSNVADFGQHAETD